MTYLKGGYMKICSKCKLRKNYDGFYKDKKAKDGYNGICKQCRLEMDRERRKKDSVWVERRKDQNSKYHKENRDQIRQRKKEWFNSDKGKISHLRSTRKYRNENKEKRYAHDAVYRATKKGELMRPKFCQICGKEGRIEAHHAKYDRDQRTAIIWICKNCHSIIHKKEI
jgi:predicted HNH restriction endonuclease